MMKRSRQFVALILIFSCTLVNALAAGVMARPSPSGEQLASAPRRFECQALAAVDEFSLRVQSTAGRRTRHLLAGDITRRSAPPLTLAAARGWDDLSPEDIRRLRRPEPYLPTEKQMRRTARSEQTASRTNLSSRHPFVRRLNRMDPFFWFLRLRSPAMLLNEEYLRNLAHSNRLSLARLLTSLSLPAWTKRVILADDLSEGRPYSRRRRYLEEFFHMLAGKDHTALDRHDILYKDAMELINDVLQLMLYPADRLQNFYTNHSALPLAVRQVLVRHYRDAPARDPNVHLVKIIRALREDVEQGTRVSVGKKKTAVADLLADAISDSINGPSMKEKIMLYLIRLESSERFSRHQPLIPGWTFTRNIDKRAA